MEVKSQIQKASLYDASTWFDRTFCTWVVPFLRLFAKNTRNNDSGEPTCSLEIEDLHRCSEEDGAERLYGNFER